jgi:hypothetical protein
LPILPALDEKHKGSRFSNRGKSLASGSCGEGCLTCTAPAAPPQGNWVTQWAHCSASPFPLAQNTLIVRASRGRSFPRPSQINLCAQLVHCASGANEWGLIPPQRPGQQWGGPPVWEAQAITSWKMHRAPKIAVCSKIGPLAGAVLPTDTPACHSHPQSLLFCKAGCPDTSRTPGGGPLSF